MENLRPYGTAAILCCLIATSAMAQEEATKSPPPPVPFDCATSDGFSDFDFWLGKWVVVSNADGSAQGTNVVTKEASGCFVYESWENLKGIPGNSMNYYDPLTKKWRQLWVGSGGYTIDISGELVDGSMALVGSISYYARGVVVPFRGTWTPIEDGSVRQFFEQKTPKDGKWNVWFDGRYIRAK